MAPTICSSVKKRQAMGYEISDARRHLRYPHLKTHPPPHLQSLYNHYLHHYRHYNPAVAIINYAFADSGAQLAASHVRPHEHLSASGNSSSRDDDDDDGSAQPVAHRATPTTGGSLSPTSATTHWRQALSISDEGTSSSSAASLAAVKCMSTGREGDNEFERFVASPGGEANQGYPRAAREEPASDDEDDRSASSAGDTGVGESCSGDDSSDTGICVRRFAFAARVSPATPVFRELCAPSPSPSLSSCSSYEYNRASSSSPSPSSAGSEYEYDQNAMDAEPSTALCVVAKPQVSLAEIALKTIMLVQRNQLLQKRLAMLQVETKQFVESVLANPENRALREQLARKSDSNNIN